MRCPGCGGSLYLTEVLPCPMASRRIGEGGVVLNDQLYSSILDEFISCSDCDAVFEVVYVEHSNNSRVLLGKMRNAPAFAL